MKNRPPSPVTGSGDTAKVLTIPTKDILSAYRAEDLGEIEPYFTKIKQVDVYECLDTGYRFYYPFGIFGDDKFYEYLQRKRPHYSHLRWEHQPALNLIDKKKKVLEVGSGSGDFLERTTKLAKEARGLEFNAKAIRASKKKGLDVIGESIQKHAKKNPAYYDVVCMFQVLEHISDVRPFLDASVRALKSGGKLIIGVPNNNPYLFRHDVLHALNLPPHHSGLWNRRALSALAGEFGLTVDSVTIEPLQEPDYYWYVQQKYRKEHSPILYWLFRPLSIGWLRRPRNHILRTYRDGRNALAIYTKQ